MPTTSTSLGGAEDVVELHFDESHQSVRFFESYEVQTGIFTQPSGFSVDLPSVADVAALQAIAKTHGSFTLSISGATQFSGWLDALGDRGNRSKSNAKIRGRDFMAPLHDGEVDGDITLEDKTPIEIVEIALKAVGLSGAPIDVDASASRVTRAGVPIVTLTGKQLSTARPKRRRRAAKCGETWLTAIQRELKHSGLFLWAAPQRDGSPVFIVSAPDGAQKPVALIWRSSRGNDPVSGAAMWSGNVEGWDYDFDTAHRFSQCKVYGRGGGLRYGNALTEGGFVDPEVVGYGITRLKTVKDVSANSNEEAAFFAARKIADSRREGFKLSYTVAGHTYDALDGSGRGVWTPDTVVLVQDDHLGLDGPYYVENVSYHNGGQEGATTVIRLLRPEDLVFGSDEAA